MEQTTIIEQLYKSYAGHGTENRPELIMGQTSTLEPLHKNHAGLGSENQPNSRLK